MKKFKKLSLLCAALGIVFATATTAFADDGKEIKKFYNFNDYTAEVGSDIMPDENWDYLAQGYNQFGSAFADDEHQRVLKANNGSAPHFYFGQSLTTGNIHISFEAKMLSVSQRLISRWYHQRKWGTATPPRRTEAQESGYSMLLNINIEPNVFKWYQKPGKDTTSMLGWDTMQSDESFDFTQWHRFDIITNGLSGNDCYANIYLDGVKMNETPIYFGASEGFHTFGFKTEVGTGGSNPQGAYIDNVNIHRFSGTESLDMNITSDERVALNDGKLKVHLSDFVDTADLTKNNVIISRKGGGSISNYSITPDANGGGFDVNFSGAIESGRYEIKLSDNVKGKLTGAVSTDALMFKTDFKTVNVDGSIYKNDFNDYTSTDGTLPNGFAASNQNSYAKSVEGQNGGDDKAFGLEAEENGRTVQRYMTKFNADIRPDSDGNISFDFTVPTADTGEVRFYLSTPNDPEKNAPNALFKVDSTGNVYIADSETANPSKKADGINLTEGWHNVSIDMRTDGENGNTVVLTFDNADNKTVSYTAPYFNNKITDGFEIGFVPKAGFKTAIDNISANTRMDIPCPEVISIKLFDNLGRELKTDKEITAMTSYAEIEFNTVVTDDTDELKKYIVLNENTWTKDFDCSVVTSDDGKNSTVICSFPQLLEEMSNYKLVVNTGIPSRLAESVKSVLPDELDFITDRTKALSISGFDSDGNASGELTFSKNDSSSADLLYGGTQYEYKTCMIDGVEVSVPLMRDFKLKRIVIDSDFTGSITESAELSNGGEGTENKYYLWKYPSLKKALINSENVLQ